MLSRDILFLAVPLATPYHWHNETGHIYLQSQQLKEKFEESEEGGIISGIPDLLLRQVSKGWQTEAKLTHKHSAQKGLNEPKPGTKPPEQKSTSHMSGKATAPTVAMQLLERYILLAGDSFPLTCDNSTPHLTTLQCLWTCTNAQVLQKGCRQR